MAVSRRILLGSTLSLVLGGVLLAPCLWLLLSSSRPGSIAPAPPPRDGEQGGGATGQFLHLTDVHPDLHYSFNSSTALSCHADEPARHGHKAKYWGTPLSACDTPLSLVNLTFDWLSSYSNSFDFVVWSGDSARHDSDPFLSRELDEIIELNTLVADKIKRTFPGTPVIPAVGNNDVHPHQIMRRGPSQVITSLLEAWRAFVPRDQDDVFLRGAYFHVDNVGPNGALRLLSINTIYWFESNKLVDGCPRRPKKGKGKHKIDAGNEELEWLASELQEAREQGKKVHLVGHVPPLPTLWYNRCLSAYTRLMIDYQDVIVGQHFGHTNNDAFFFLKDDPSSDSKKKKRKGKKGEGEKNGGGDKEEDDTPVRLARVDDDLREIYDDLPPLADADLGNYAVLNVAPSVVPTYLPGLRIYTYNTSAAADLDGISCTAPDEEAQANVRLQQGRDGSAFWGRRGEQEVFAAEASAPVQPGGAQEDDGDDEEQEGGDDDDDEDNEQEADEDKSEGEKHKRRRKAWRDASCAPSRRNTHLSLLGYTQFVLNLTRINAHEGYGPGPRGKRILRQRGSHGARPYPATGAFEVEYSTFSAREIVARRAQEGERSVWNAPEWTSLIETGASGGLASDRADDPAARPSQDVSILAAALEASGATPYSLPDLTVGSWLRLAKRLTKDSDLWARYVHLLFVSSGAEDTD